MKISPRTLPSGTRSSGGRPPGPVARFLRPKPLVNALPTKAGVGGHEGFADELPPSCLEAPFPLAALSLAATIWVTLSALVRMPLSVAPPPSYLKALFPSFQTPTQC